MRALVKKNRAFMDRLMADMKHKREVRDKKWGWVEEQRRIHAAGKKFSKA